MSAQCPQTRGAVAECAKRQPLELVEECFLDIPCPYLLEWRTSGGGWRDPAELTDDDWRLGAGGAPRVIWPIETEERERSMPANSRKPPPPLAPLSPSATADMPTREA